jgi:hypothetical protein
MSAVRGNVTTIVASAAQSASGNSGVLNLPSLLGGAADGIQFILNVTASSAPTTLDVYLQHSPNAGANWYDFGHFAQVGAVSSNTQALSWTRRMMALVSANTGVVATGDAALAAGVVINGPIVDSYFRAKWVIAGTSYTFSLVAVQDRD